jgi:hypothetical protein
LVAINGESDSKAGSWKLEAGSWKLEAGSYKLEARTYRRYGEIL